VLIPCIDLQGGQAVQLVGGRKQELAVADVFGLLDRFAGYAWLHLIDLDEAMRTGSNNTLVRALCRAAKRKNPQLRLRVGGGVRTVARARGLLRLGVRQVIVGSSAFRRGKINFPFLRRLRSAVSRRRIVIALDTLKGRIAVHGWRHRLPLAALDAVGELEPFCAAFLSTDIGREGTMRGADLAWFRELRAASGHPIIAAGGICSRREVAALEELGMDAAVGMAVYKGVLR
jgi:phosphoribosylformimino-5-aminoimidazole carboxamide ribonucleotide (ProFAR) isomerase